MQTRRHRPHGQFRRGLHVVGLALRGAKGPFAIGIGGATLYAMMTVAASLVLGWVTDEVLLDVIASGQIDRQLLTVAVIAILGVATFKAAGVVGRRLGGYIAQYTLQAKYRRQVTRRYLELPAVWHRKHSTGQLLSNANADVESAFFVAAPLSMAVGAAVLTIVTAVLLVITDPLLALIGFSVGPVLALANWHYQRRMRTAATLAQQSRADVAETAHESFDAALVIKTLGREAAEVERFAQRSHLLRDRMIRVGRLRALFDPIIEALPNVAILLVLLIGARRVQIGALTPGDLVLFAYLFRLLALPIRVFGWMLGEMPRAIVGWDRVRRVLQATGDVDYGSRQLPDDGPATIAFDDVSYLHPATERDDLVEDQPAATDTQTLDVTAVDLLADGAIEVNPATDETVGIRGIADVTFAIDAGNTVALVGPTGSGKSTIANLMVRQFDTDQGHVRLDGADVRELARNELARHAAIVFQDAFLFNDTIRGNITLGDDYDDFDVHAAAQVAQADGFIAELADGYATLVGERGATLSGGQRQRIALARALIRRPRLLVLDDATSAVDPAVEARILQGLADGPFATTVVIAAYRQRSIMMADEVLYINNGRLVAHGSHSQLLDQVPGYHQLVTAYEHQDA
ncbi:MAG: ABC transporter ATP-binding protein [Nitriliruptoraceae bacterium]